MARTVFLHVGVAKTGTTFLQRILFLHRARLRTAGLLYPGVKPADQYIASIDLRQLDRDRYTHLQPAGMWARIAEEVNEFDGNAVISHETLARCTSSDISRAVDSLGGAEVKVVLTVRDLGRQIPAVWQETLKNKAVSDYDTFLRDIFVNEDSGEYKYFWKPQDVGRVVRRWAKVVGIDNVTVVTVPPTGAPRDELWNRFARAIALPDVDIELPSTGSNTSLGAGEAELLRYLNEVLPEDLPWPRYTRVVKRQFAELRLATRSTTRMTVPAQWHGAVHERSRSMLRYLRRSGCTIIGKVSDLDPVLPEAAVAGPGDLSQEQLMTTAAEVVRDLLLLPQLGRRGPGAGPRPAPVPPPASLPARIKRRLLRRLR